MPAAAARVAPPTAIMYRATVATPGVAAPAVPGRPGNGNAVASCLATPAVNCCAALISNVPAMAIAVSASHCKSAPGVPPAYMGSKASSPPNLTSSGPASPTRPQPLAAPPVPPA
jgi:hypothetical protein